jgi:hypothetical protein
MIIQIIEQQSNVAVARITTDLGVPLVLAELELIERVLLLHGLHIQGGNVRINELGVVGIRRIMRDAMENLDVDEIIIEGAARTTGANPGRRPRRLRFTRPVSPES